MTNTLVTIGSVIRSQRLRRGLPLQTVAARGYLSVSMVAEVERGEKNPSFVTLQAIACGLGMSLGDLLLFMAQEVE